MERGRLSQTGRPDIIIDWPITGRMRARLCTDVLAMASDHGHREGEATAFHSDRASNTPLTISRNGASGTASPSLGSRRDVLGHSVIENVFSHLETEMHHQHSFGNRLKREPLSWNTSRAGILPVGPTGGPAVSRNFDPQVDRRPLSRPFNRLEEPYVFVLRDMHQHSCLETRFGPVRVPGTRGLMCLGGGAYGLQEPFIAPRNFQMTWIVDIPHESQDPRS